MSMTTAGRLCAADIGKKVRVKDYPDIGLEHTFVLEDIRTDTDTEVIYGGSTPRRKVYKTTITLDFQEGRIAVGPGAEVDIL